MATAPKDNRYIGRSERIARRMQSTNDPQLKAKIYLEPVVGTVAKRVQRKIGGMNPENPIVTLWQRSPNPEKALRRAKRQALRYPPDPEVTFSRDVKSLFTLMEEIILNSLLDILERQDRNLRSAQLPDSLGKGSLSRPRIVSARLDTIPEEEGSIMEEAILGGMEKLWDISTKPLEPFATAAEIWALRDVLVDPHDLVRDRPAEVA
ncbi:hypothetical protein SISNIDRAFT_464709 [Sistotremastrum niveocremeum HHB9708]|uniref:Uncharacterized protein n=1 Tax=Sistotremastrum niveocremeum HHB9708 TaxID=1314777 RepID=A0A164WGX9_9AGAM|nr:hypothetical protein SISNIDRAFT_464709 [Sistotremastrum niveocremeum HHB9708]